MERIRQIHAETGDAYGAPRILLDLRDEGVQVSKKRIARLMRAAGLRGADGRRDGAPKTTVRNPARPSAPDLVCRDFQRAAPNQLWVCDIKYIQTGQGFLFLAAVQDVYSRRIVGWSMRDNLETELVLDALGMAVTTRGSASAGVICHSDHGSQPEFNRSSQRWLICGRDRSLLEELGGVWSYWRVGDHGRGVAAAVIINTPRLVGDAEACVSRGLE